MSRPICHPNQEPQVDIFTWHPKYQSCLRFFLDRAQHSASVQTIATYINIRLPWQKPASQTPSSARRTPPLSSTSSSATASSAAITDGGNFEPLVVYVRRLVATGFDTPAMLHAFFGDDWAEGMGPLHETERRNYLFAAKSDSWLKVKTAYDMPDGQSVPFLRPLQGVSEREIANAESSWSDWLAMQDWMLGPRAPPAINDVRRLGI
ncbi:hypothetical protein CDD81_3752 [Ophiocordyceps australis]|uniref:Ilp is an apoptosis inhibitor n=1 Tax=Ophiocordyceps australis TaxID=1399860 RepID=A0A2C5Y5Y5_9HYPO|nr:hypothetical protein CDD81_3752 [Ophiocordyceps australis]